MARKVGVGKMEVEYTGRVLSSTEGCARLIVREPPMYVILGKKRPKKFYLTNQMFYSGIHWATRKKVVGEVKSWLSEWLKDLPEMKKVSIQMDFGGIKDLDNKAFFWTKVLQDWMVSSGRLKDDSVEYVDKLWYNGDKEGGFMQILFNYEFNDG